ncbi:amidohydrolase [Actinophytocola gossypii]|uniref:Amidohydrolase family protein n=1 Tax=Actinophytocola gossypii TaxID=2812003 RepID=A0ABT2JD88_9PSEU|nr:amidohydrolase family protein [Actinophytocola gossypii]MCT2585400.1 amidohydrolase family protein [Actinophytocola gossypii]
MSLTLHDVALGLTGRRATVRVEHGRVAAIEPVGGGGDVDGRGGTLLPGLVDAHAHLLQWASARRRVDLAAATSAAHAASLLAASAPPGEDLVRGAHFHAALWPDRPHKTVLDRVLPTRPAALFSNDLHTLWLNSAALRLAGRDHPTGVFVEDECMALTAALPAPAVAVSDDWVLAATDAAAARGVTAIADYEYTDTIADWTRRAARREPSTRIRCVVARFALERAIERGHRTGDVLPGARGLLTVGPLKLFLDGSLNTRTAYCRDHYHDGHRGQLLLPPADLLPLTRRATEHGIALALHAIGDDANTIALDTFAALGTGGRIEHAQLLDVADVPRFAALGVTAGVQPAHAPDDRDAADAHWPGRTTRAFAYRSLLDAGARLEFGSDAPVAPLDPWDAIASAITRTDDDRPPWHPEQALTLAEALAASTGGRTTVEVGDPADLVLIGRDLSALPPDELREVPITATVLDGHLTHAA